MSMQVMNRSNVVAGTFLVGSILLAVAISFVLSDISDQFGSKKTQIFRFPTSVGVLGLKPGAHVTFGGLNIGKVQSIEAHARHDDELGIDIVVAHDVTVALVADLVLFEDAFADLSLPMLGGVSSINIPSAGSGSYEGGPEDANTLLDEGEILRGRFAPSILTQLGFSTEDAEKIQKTIDDVKLITSNANEVSQSVKRMSTALEPEFVDSVDHGKSTLANIRSFSEKLNGDSGWSGRVDGIMGKVDVATGKLSPAIDDARSAVNEAREVIADGKPRINNILANVEDTTGRVKTESMDKIDELLSKGTLALGSYKELAENTNSMISINRPKINATLDSARSIGVKSELFVEEIRSQPWRLLKKPTTEELEREPIYEAARAYADAVSELRIASEALDGAVGRVSEGGSPVDTVNLARIAKVVESAYERYEEAEKGLLEKLRTPSPSTTP